MELDLFFWLLARATGLAAFVALGVALLSGTVLRTAVLDRLATNRALTLVHEWSWTLWMPLGAAHVATILLDETARIAPRDVVVPLGVPYGTLGIGLGTLTFDLFLVIMLTSWLRRYMSQRLWRWIHRLAYAGFVLLFLHALLSGTDFMSPVVSAFAWSIAFGLGILSLARVLWGRLPA